MIVPRCPFEISEAPVPLPTWATTGGRSALEVVEDDTRSLLRAAAEARHALDEAERRHDEQTERLLLRLLEVKDALERLSENLRAKAEASTPQTKIWAGNVRTIDRLLSQVLGDQQIVPLELVEEGFDPHFQTAPETVADPSRLDGTITRVIRKGYLWRRRVLRKAEVVIVRNN